LEHFLDLHATREEAHFVRSLMSPIESETRMAQQRGGSELGGRAAAQNGGSDVGRKEEGEAEKARDAGTSHAVPAVYAIRTYWW
jgi:hypothetical protein